MKIVEKKSVGLKFCFLLETSHSFIHCQSLLSLKPSCRVLKPSVRQSCIVHVFLCARPDTRHAFHRTYRGNFWNLLRFLWYSDTNFAFSLLSSLDLCPTSLGNLQAVWITLRVEGSLDYFPQRWCSHPGEGRTFPCKSLFQPRQSRQPYVFQYPLSAFWVTAAFLIQDHPAVTVGLWELRESLWFLLCIPSFWGRLTVRNWFLSRFLRWFLTRKISLGTFHAPRKLSKACLCRNLNCPNIS